MFSPLSKRSSGVGGERVCTSVIGDKRFCFYLKKNIKILILNVWLNYFTIVRFNTYRQNSQMIFYNFYLLSLDQFAAILRDCNLIFLSLCIFFFTYILHPVFGPRPFFPNVCIQLLFLISSYALIGVLSSYLFWIEYNFITVNFSFVLSNASSFITHLIRGISSTSLKHHIPKL